MRNDRVCAVTVVLGVLAMAASPLTQTSAPTSSSATASAPPKLAAYKQEVAQSIDGMYDLAQQMVDSVRDDALVRNRRRHRDRVGPRQGPGDDDPRRADAAGHRVAGVVTRHKTYLDQLGIKYPTIR